MLTPQDLQEVSFEKAKIGGYVMKSVDEFLEPLMDDYLTLYKENAVLKSKMRLLVERLEEYRASEGQMKQALADTQRSCDDMIAEAQRKSDALLQQAQEEAANKSRSADSAVASENERLRRAKESTADFVAAVEAQLARQMRVLEALKSLELPKDRLAKSAKRAYDYEAEKDPPAARESEQSADRIAEQIEQNVGRLTGSIPSPKADAKPDPSATTRVMPAIELGKRATQRLENLQFGTNYQE